MEEKLNILLVEDDPADSRLIDLYLKESLPEKFSLCVAGTLADGVKAVKTQKFSVIMLDLSLPDSTGLDTFIKFFQASPEVPILVLTGMDNESIGMQAMKLGAQDFLIKGNLKSNELKRSINYSIERYKLLKDISENAKKLEEKTNDLLRQQLRLSEAQKLAHIGSWEWNIIDDEMILSDELYNIYDLKPDTIRMTLEDFINLVYSEDKEYVKNELERSCHFLRSFSFFYHIIGADKTLRTIHARGEVIAEEDKKPVRMLGTAQDITERMHEEELEKLALAATKSYNSVVIANRNGEIEWVNEGFNKLTGYTLKDVKNTHGELLRQGDDTGLSPGSDFHHTIIKDKKPVTYESKNFTKNGVAYWVITTLTPVLGKSGEVERVIAIDTDISQRKRMEEELIRANRIAEHSLTNRNKALAELMEAKHQLEKLMKIKESFLTNMSHEIRTPMNAIVGFTDLVLKTRLDPEQKQYIDAIKISGENLLVIINDILDFSKIQSGKLIFEQIEMRIRQLVSTATELMLPKAIEKNISLSSRVEKEIPGYLIGDPTRLTQILLNLIGNAIKFTERGEVKISVDLMKEDEDSVQISISVEDTGIGIPETKLPGVFESFTQAANDTTRKYGGTGLGLAIVKQLVELQGGSISVKSKVEAGTRFEVTLPFKKAIGPAGIKNENAGDSSVPIDGLRILLVEDNYLNQILARKVLQDWKCIVDIAENGRVALEKLEKNNYDLILMDIQLPEMDGYEATRTIRKTFHPPKSDIPIIAMTAHALEGEAGKCFNAGMNEYISKPFSKKILYSKIAAAMNEKNIPGTNSRDRIRQNYKQNGKVIDLTYLTEFSNGSNEFIIEMIETFMKQTPECVKGLENHLAGKNWEMLRAVAHKMKPSFYFMGIKEIQNTIQSVEECSALKKNLELLPSKINQVKTICTRALEELEEEIKKYK